ncbi:MAG: hypothetical protein QG597_3326 [Actinomycetota bacterium]|nr:hypothetical protein [Actinomycetota bacterium]
MRELMELYGDRIVGAISGWDRVRFRGTVRWLASLRGMGSYMGAHGILLKNFGEWAAGITSTLRRACAAQADSLGIPLRYLDRAGIDKEALARQIAQERGVDTGDICMFSVVEPCVAPLIKGDRASGHLELHMAPRKCIFIYHYWNDPVIGFGHTRLQTWLPLSVTVCLNGRHWLERQLLAESVPYVKDDNCFPFIADLQRAQQLLGEQLRTNWPALLTGLLDRNCPQVRSVFTDPPLQYYWSADESEWATDITFRSAADLDRLVPSLLRFGLITAQSPTVMRFFGRKVTGGKFQGQAPDEVVSDLRRRYEGIRLKHWVNRNSLKMYNKAGNLLRIEPTINNTRDFKVFRHPDDDPSRPASWQKMRKGVSDLHRRAEVSEACNQRYAEHLATALSLETLQQTVGPLCSRVRRYGRTHRALNPWGSDDAKLIAFIARGENHINGFRNRDLRQWLYPATAGATDKEQRHRDAGRVTRKLRLLRAHGLIRKAPRTTRYLLTAKGRKTTTAILAASAADIKRLLEIAA